MNYKDSDYERHVTEQLPLLTVLGDKLVSVIIPSYNLAHLVCEAIESVRAQSYPYIEIIVVDDGSSDNTRQHVSRFSEVRYIYQHNQGISAARNAGLRASKGQYVVFLDADDKLLSDAIARNVEALRDNPDCALAAGHQCLIAYDGSFLITHPPRLLHIEPTLLGLNEAQQEPGAHYAALLKENYIVMPAVVMYQQWVFDTVGGFDPSLRAGEDHDLYLRIAQHFPIYCHGQLLAEYRQRPESATTNFALMFDMSMYVLRRQWPYITQQHDKRYIASFRQGIRHYRNLYGLRLFYSIFTHIQKYEWRKAFNGITALMFYKIHPDLSKKYSKKPKAND